MQTLNPAPFEITDNAKIYRENEKLIGKKFVNDKLSGHPVCTVVAVSEIFPKDIIYQVDEEYWDGKTKHYTKNEFASYVRSNLGPEPDSLTPVKLKGNLPKGYKAFNWLTRPYWPITSEQYNSFVDNLEELRTDFLESPDGKIFTVGNADGGFAIMPIQDCYLKQLF